MIAAAPYLGSFILGLSRGGLKGIAPIFILLLTIVYGQRLPLENLINSDSD